MSARNWDTPEDFLGTGNKPFNVCSPFLRTVTIGSDWVCPECYRLPDLDNREKSGCHLCRHITACSAWCSLMPPLVRLKDLCANPVLLAAFYERYIRKP